MIDIVNLDKDFEVDEKLLISVTNKVLEEEGINKNIEVAFVKEEEIQALNKKYRNIDKATDVLSFGTIDDLLPQIVICLSEVNKNGEDFKKELSKVLIHGILHLTGMDHIEKKDADEMFKKQDKYLVK